MMKKSFLALLAAASMIFTLTACGDAAASTPASTPSDSEVSSSPQATPASAAASDSEMARGDSTPIQVEKAVVYNHFFSSVGVEEMQDGMLIAQVVITEGDPAIYTDWRELMNCCTILENGEEIGAYIQSGNVSIGDEQSFGMQFWVPQTVNVEELSFVMDGTPVDMPEIYYVVDGFTAEESNEADLAAESTTTAPA